MDEYISKQKAKDLMGCCLASTKAEYKAAKDEFTKARFGDYISAIQSMIDVVGSIEAADVQPVKHGRWIANNKDNRGYADCYTCTNCDDYVYTFTLMKDCEFEYCPNCGARMDGDAE